MEASHNSTTFNLSSSVLTRQATNTVSQVARNTSTPAPMTTSPFDHASSNAAQGPAPLTNLALLEQLRRAQIAAAAAAAAGMPQSNAATCQSAALLSSVSAYPVHQQWEHNQRQLLLLLLQQQRQQNLQQYIHSMGLLASANNALPANFMLQQQQANALLSPGSRSNSVSFADTRPSGHNPSVNCPSGVHLQQVNIARGSAKCESNGDNTSPQWTSPRAIHDFSTPWGSSHEADDFGEAAAKTQGLPLPSEEEFTSHLVAMQATYIE
eukprot:TRINITY_DN59153_c0_g1_i1.p1 TRINITY_DN59153_c0_g1~~TRINITY_DN59153_c0_g1_i1.p1  ORF type:complete len:267 (-),score=3.21 TRINITY_DN59153_c0_g1_i1:571-1371(-)